MLPLMAEALGGLTKVMQFAVLSQKLENFNSVEEIKTLGTFSASAQPLTPREILLKPEGLRKWKWLKIWTTQQLQTDGYVLELGVNIQYRVMQKSDWRTAGSDVIEYEIRESSDVESEAP